MCGVFTLEAKQVESLLVREWRLRTPALEWGFLAHERAAYFLLLALRRLESAPPAGPLRRISAATVCDVTVQQLCALASEAETLLFSATGLTLQQIGKALVALWRLNLHFLLHLSLLVNQKAGGSALHVANSKLLLVRQVLKLEHSFVNHVSAGECSCWCALGVLVSALFEQGRRMFVGGPRNLNPPLEF